MVVEKRFGMFLRPATEFASASHTNSGPYSEYASGSCVKRFEPAQAGQAPICVRRMIQPASRIATAISKYHSSEQTSAAEENSCSLPQQWQRAKQLINANS